MVPLGVTRKSLLVDVLETQKLPSGATVIWVRSARPGVARASGTCVITPLDVMFAMRPTPSGNHRLPSAAVTRLPATKLPVENDVTEEPSIVMRPIQPAVVHPPACVAHEVVSMTNQMLPSGPDTIPSGGCGT